ATRASFLTAPAEGESARTRPPAASAPRTVANARPRDRQECSILVPPKVRPPSGAVTGGRCDDAREAAILRCNRSAVRFGNREGIRSRPRAILIQSKRIRDPAVSPGGCVGSAVRLSVAQKVDFSIGVACEDRPSVRGVFDLYGEELSLHGP